MKCFQLVLLYLLLSFVAIGQSIDTSFTIKTIKKYGYTVKIPNWLKVDGGSAEDINFTPKVFKENPYLILILSSFKSKYSNLEQFKGVYLKDSYAKDEINSYYLSKNIINVSHVGSTILGDEYKVKYKKNYLDQSTICDEELVFRETKNAYLCILYIPPRDKFDLNIDKFMVFLQGISIQ